SSEALVSRLRMCGDRAAQAVLGGGYEFVAPNLRGQHTDEIILGAEYEIMPDLTVGANYVHRTLPTVIEDISIDGGNTYLIANPGYSFDDEAADLRRLADNTDDAALADLYRLRADQLAYVKRLQKPVRDYDAIQILARQRPTKASLLQASYTYASS